ncbi:MAG TPA: MFS transporter [Thermosynechococcaceae cyanobacterium]
MKLSKWFKTQTSPVAATSSGNGFGALLHNRSFLALWIGQLLSQVADKVLFVFLIAVLANYQPPAGWENSARSALMVAVTLPAILFGSAAGIFVDRFDKRQILGGCNLLRGVLILLLPFLPKAFVVLLTLGFLESVLTQFFAPAEQAVIPLLVPKQGLMSANALFSTTLMGSLIVGFAIGEPLLTLSSAAGAFGRELLLGGLYIAAALILYALPLREQAADPLLVKPYPWSDFKAGLAYLKHDRLVSNALLQLTLLYSVFAALMVLAINLAEEVGLKADQFGFLLAGAGVGMVFGAAILGHWGDHFRHKPLPLIGFLIMAACLGGFGFVHSLPIGLLLSGCLGVGSALVGVPMQTLIQQQTPESMRGKVFGLQNNVVNIALSLPLAIAGPLTDRLGLRGVLLGMSLITIGVGVIAWRATRQELRLS